MGDGNDVGRPNGVVIDRVVAEALNVVRDDSAGMEAFLRAYFVHVDADDLARRSPEDLFGMAAEHAQQGSAWQPGTASVRVMSPLLEVDGWESPHSVLLTVTDDLPFLVDSVTMELTRLGVGIHLVVHPVLCDERSTGGSFDGGGDGATGPPASFIAIEIDRQADPAGLEAIEQGVRRVLGDVRSSVEDWPTMRDRMLEIAEDLSSACTRPRSTHVRSPAYRGCEGWWRRCWPALAIQRVVTTRSASSTFSRTTRATSCSRSMSTSSSPRR